MRDFLAKLESIKMGLDLASGMKSSGSRYDILSVVEAELRNLINECVEDMRVDNED